jgi:hypothetical protein
LWIRHVVQESDRSIELHLALLGAGDGKINGTQGMPCVLLGLAACFARAARKQGDHQTGASAKEDGTTSALD